jgi:Ca2+-transporting ATPase
LSDDELTNAVSDVSVFARVTPGHKLRIIRAYKSAGNIVAMTGDGVNDAPSLSAADLGVSMGIIGTEVAKSASDIVLLDDNMSSIISAIEEGRSIYKTIKKVILYLFSTSAGEVLTITGAILLGYMVPILPAQIIWLNFVTDGFLDVALAMEPKEKGLLRERRNKESRRLVDRLMYTRIIIMASVMAIGTLYLFGDYANGDPKKAWTISLTLLAVFQWFNALNCRSHKLSILQMNPFSNLFLIGAFVIVVTLQMVALYTSVGQKLLHTVPLTLSEWGAIFAIASSIIVAEEIRKYLYRSHGALSLEQKILQ